MRQAAATIRRQNAPHFTPEGNDPLAGISSVAHTNHPDLSHTVLDLELTVGEKAVLSVKSLRARVGVGDPKQSGRAPIDDGVEERSPDP